MKQKPGQKSDITGADNKVGQLSSRNHTLNGNHKEDACSLSASLTALNSDGINFWFVTIIPETTSRNFPFEKSKGFPAASVTTPPASTQVQLPNNNVYNSFIGITPWDAIIPKKCLK